MYAHAVPFFQWVPGKWRSAGQPSTGGRFGSLAAQRNSTGVPCEARAIEHELRDAHRERVEPLALRMPAKSECETEGCHPNSISR